MHHCFRKSTRKAALSQGSGILSLIRMRIAQDLLESFADSCFALVVILPGFSTSHVLLSLNGTVFVSIRQQSTRKTKSWIFGTNSTLNFFEMVMALPRTQTRWLLVGGSANFCKKSLFSLCVEQAFKLVKTESRIGKFFGCGLLHYSAIRGIAYHSIKWLQKSVTSVKVVYICNGWVNVSCAASVDNFGKR